MTWQDVLWTLPSDLGWLWYALWGLIAAAAAAIIFLVAIVGQPFSAMLVCRVLFCIGLALIPLAVFNSGLQPWVPVFYAVSGLIGALSLGVERCDREMEITTVGGAIAEKARRALAMIRRALGRF